MDRNTRDLSADTLARLSRIRHVLSEYEGFSTPEDRRESDEMLRRRLVSLFMELRRLLETVSTYASKHGHEPVRFRAGRLADSAEDLADRVRLAPYAFSLCFTGDILPVEFQEILITHDARLVEIDSRFRDLMDCTLCENSDLDAVLATVQQFETDLDEELERRLAVIMEYR
ncbi:hypothetical protein HQ520_04970 [bacterium]|nr:hypothetical protein [bacterium]